MSWANISSSDNMRENVSGCPISSQGDFCLEFKVYTFKVARNFIRYNACPFFFSVAEGRREKN